MVTSPLTPDPTEIAWHDWLTETELATPMKHETFAAREAYNRHLAQHPQSQPR
ncbi:hypothetical protein ACFYY1_42875 [Streptomyces sp. NPDC001890]|uniref:hypothetical protein n=1 Tax=Streptomyces sp. NPDC001890 TaxID=3364620 RepID=UPI0036CF55BE